jgi:hypothetical protein
VKTVDVYEVSRAVRTTAMDYVDFVQIQRTNLREWSEAIPLNDLGLESPAYVRHSQPIIQLREPGKRDVFVAIGPELFELLRPAVNIGMHKTLEGMSHAAKQMLVVQNGLTTRLEMEQEIRARAESNATLQAEVAQHMSRRISSFLGLNVLVRVWRAIIGRL